MSNLGFELSAEGIVMLTIGGVGHLAGALFGVPAFMVIRHVASTINPYHWLLVIGVVLIVTVLFLPRGLYGVIEKWRTILREKGT